ncbi:hypothetical protein Tco_0373961 [Tanacetum coccineum]
MDGRGAGYCMMLGSASSGPSFLVASSMWLADVDCDGAGKVGGILSSHSAAFPFREKWKKRSLDVSLVAPSACMLAPVLWEEDASESKRFLPAIVRDSFLPISTELLEARETLIEWIAFVMIKEEGKLHMNYLGDPFLAQKLYVTDYKVLVDRVLRKVLDWKNKMLSYVALAIALKERQRWIGSSFVDQKIKRLDIKPLYEWNKVLLTKYIWNIAAKKDTLWVKWVTMVKLKGKSIQEVEIENANSPLCELISRRARYEADIPEDVNVCDMIEGRN